VRESIPIEHLLKVYMEDEFIEEDTEVIDTEEIISQDPVVEEDEEKNEEVMDENKEAQEKEQEQTGGNSNVVTKRQTITFDDIDRVRVLDSESSSEQAEEFVNAPKTLERLEEISIRNFAKRKEEENGYDDDDGETEDTLRIGDPVSLGDLDVDVFAIDS
jgi:hypothetical protein